MRIKVEHVIILEIDGDMIIELTPEQFVELHDKMTTLYNDNYEAITKVTNPD